jgi:hypothetical protein
MILTIPWCGPHLRRARLSTQDHSHEQRSWEHIMWKTIAVVGASAAIVGGAGTAALAASGNTPSTTSASVNGSALNSSANGSTTQAGRQRTAIDRLRRAVQATWVSENKKTRTFTTHDAIRGQVTAVSATSITVRAADNVSQTYNLNSATKVRTRATKAASSIAEVKSGDPVWVVGTGTITLTASRVVDTKK